MLNEKSKKNLSILVLDHNDDESLLHAISSINNQIGFKKELIEIIILTRRNFDELSVKFAIFSDLDLRYIFVPETNDGVAWNMGLSAMHGAWVTFLDSRDQLYADGSLLDFMNCMGTPQNAVDILIFKYVYPIMDDENRVIDFKNADYANVIYGKYFNWNFIQRMNLQMNSNLDRYLLDDFVSRALALRPDSKWYDYANYFLSDRGEIADNVEEFIEYRHHFMQFITEKNVQRNDYVSDLVWSITNASELVLAANLENNAIILKKLAALCEFGSKMGEVAILVNDYFVDKGLTNRISYQKIMEYK